MFRRLEAEGDDAPEQRVAFSFDGQALSARAGDTVAAALMLAGIDSLRDTPVSAAPRAPFCLMGSCFDCLVEIDGIPNRQACMVEIAQGMAVRRQKGAALLALECEEAKP